MTNPWVIFVSTPDSRYAYGPFDSRLDADIWVAEHRAYLRTDATWSVTELRDKGQVSRDRD